MNNLYLLLNLGTIAVPLLLSFDRKVAFYKQWRYLWPAILLTAAAFIAWDVWFATSGVWGFNPRYLTGFKLFGLPIEEVLFFITVPYACLFIYETLNAYVPQRRESLEKMLASSGADAQPRIGRAQLTNFILIALLGFLAVYHFGKWYTSLNFAFGALLLTLLAWLRPAWTERFYFFYLIQLVPFLLVNGILTGTGIEEQVVWYSSDHIMGPRLGTIPVEDTVYSMSLLLSVVLLFEYFRSPSLKN